MNGQKYNNSLANTKVLLYSGGLDSYLISYLWKPDVRLYIDVYGRYSEAEISRLPMDVKVVNFSLLGNFEQKNLRIPLRNAYFLMIASNYGNNLCLGAVKGDETAKDKSPQFLTETENWLNMALDDPKNEGYKHIAIEKTYTSMTKAQLIEEYLRQGGDIERLRQESFSCYTPVNEEECFDCFPCWRKFCHLHYYGAVYSENEERKMLSYAEKFIIRRPEEGGYQGTFYADRKGEAHIHEKTIMRLREKWSD